MNFLKECVDYMDKHYHEKWAKAIARAKKKYSGRDVMTELEKEERQSLTRTAIFFLKEAEFFKKLYSDSFKKGNVNQAGMYVEILKQLSSK